MHVGLIVEHADRRRGGAEAYAHALIERFRHHGHELTLRSRTGGRSVGTLGVPGAIRPRYYARRFLPQLRKAGAERVLTLQPVPGCDFYQPHMGILAASVPPHLEPVPQPWRGLRRWNPMRRAHFAMLERIEAEAVRPPTRVLALSPRVSADLKRIHPHADEAVLCRAGVDLERFRPADTAERAGLRLRLGLPDGPLLLFAANNYLLKGLATAIDALVRLPGVYLAVAGKGDEHEFRILAVRAGVGDRIFWRGWDEHLPELLRSADALVHPTYYDTAALVVLEALASGTPAVTTTRDGNADLALTGGGASLAEPGDAGALAQEVAELLGMDRTDRAVRARAAVQDLDAEKMLDRVVECVTCASCS